jgi:predicted ferric reductase
MKAKLSLVTVFITVALIVLTVPSVYYVFKEGSTSNMASNIILLICLFFLTWTALLVSRTKYSNLPPN